MTTHTISLPTSIHLRSPYSTRIVALLREAIARDLHLASWSSDTKTRRYAIRLTERDEDAVRTYMRIKGLQRTARTIAQLTYAAWLARSQPTVQTFSQPSAPPSPQTPSLLSRPDQSRYFKGIWSLASNQGANPIILAEGGTGIGKSRVLAALALQLSASSPVVITAPSIQVMAQIASEFLEISPGTHIAILLGRAQFVDPAKLELWLSNEDIDPQDTLRIKEWIQQGGPMVQGSTYSSSLSRLCPGIAFLMDDVITLCPQLAEADIACNEYTDNDVPSMRVYAAMRSQARTASIVLCTHAAIIMDRRLRFRGLEPMLPDLPYSLLVDEAHQLASVAESSFSVSVSLILLRNLLLQMRPTLSGAGKAAEYLDALVTTLRKTFPENGPISSKDIPSTTLTQLTKSLEALRKDDRASKAVRSTIYSALEVLNALRREDYGVQIRYSPVRRHPSILCGPLTLRRFFTEFWESVPMAVLSSGTLLLPGRSPMDGLNSTYITQLLHLPVSRIFTTTPVHPTWTRAYTIHTPMDNEMQELIPPTESGYPNAPAYNQAVQIWYQNVARTLYSIADTARGGTLVLLTGYETISGIAEVLQATEIAPRLVVQSRDTGYAVAKHAYLDVFTKGLRPVWLATGPAWTGLDLSDKSKPATEDFLLTDLVIPRLPFGTEHSTIHERRKEIRGFLQEVYRTAFQFRQGIGRLVRRKGVTHRRLWVLDARIWLENAPWYMKYFKAFIDNTQ